MTIASKVPADPQTDTTDGAPDLTNERTWQDAVCALIDSYAANERCFSSGEIAKELREQRADFRFAVTQLGEFVKDLFHEGAIEYRDSYGRVAAAVQVPRRTGGNSRTPANTEVFVYAPTPALGSAHDFEVEIPRPGFTPTDLERQQFAAAVAQANAPMVASVHADGRLCIPRRAFEKLSHATNVSIKGGDKVWVGSSDDGSSLSIYLEASDGCSVHALSPDRGRVRFTAPANLQAFPAGASYAIAVENDSLRIVLDGRSG